MKQSLNSTTKVGKTQQLLQGKHNSALLFSLILLSGVILFTACTKQDAVQPGTTIQSSNKADANADAISCNVSPETQRELKQVREATEKYQDINNAKADGYVDINLVMPNMGYHFQKENLVDSVFDLTKPEFLVYNKKKDGSFELVAVEYAIPIANSPDAPKGFTGKKDMWDYNTLNTGLWTLHAWVWKNNPDGVFNMTNPTVHVR